MIASLKTKCLNERLYSSQFEKIASMEWLLYVYSLYRCMVAHAYGANDDLIMKPGCIVRHSFTAVILWLLIQQHRNSYAGVFSNSECD